MAQQPPDVLRVAEEYQRRLRRRETQAVRTLTTDYARLARRLASEATKLQEDVERLRGRGEAVPPWRVAQLERYRDLMQQTEQELGALGADGERIIRTLQSEGIRLGMDMAEAQLTALVPEGILVTFNRLPTGALEMMIGFLQDGSPLKLLLDAIGTEAGKRIGELLTEGLALGWNPRKVAAAMRREVGMALTRSLRIARTEMLRAWRKSSIQGYRDQGSLIKGYKRHAQADDRTCIACLLMDGFVYQTEEDFTDHVQGRCAVIPITRSWAELGFEGIEDTNPEWTKGREWFLDQNAGTQRKIVGDAMYEAWKGGEIDLEDMKTLHRSQEWGDSWQQASLKAAKEAAERRRVQ